jgi:hypothetical protein
MAHQVIMPDWEEVIFFGDAGDILTLLESEREAKRLQWPAYQCKFLVEFILLGGLYSISFYKMVKLVVLYCLWNKSLSWAFPLHVFKYLWNSYLHSYWVDNWAQYAWGSMRPEEVTYYCIDLHVLVYMKVVWQFLHFIIHVKSHGGSCDV